MSVRGATALTGVPGGVAATAWSAVAAVTVAVVLWFVGVTVPFAVAAGVLMLAAGIGWAGFSGAGDPAFARERPLPRPGTRSDVTQLAWSLRGVDGRISDTGAKRLRAFARGRLALAGLDLDAPVDADAVRRLVGAEAHALLVGPRRPTLAAVERCLNRLEGVTPARAPIPARGRARP